MRKVLFIFFVIFSLGFGADYEHFSIELENGWQAHDMGDGTIGFGTSDSVGFSVAISPSEGQNCKELTSMYIDILGGQNAKFEDNKASFEFSSDGINQKVQTLIVNDNFVLITISDHNNEQIIQKMLSSLKYK